MPSTAWHTPGATHAGYLPAGPNGLGWGSSPHVLGNHLLSVAGELASLWPRQGLPNLGVKEGKQCVVMGPREAGTGRGRLYRPRPTRPIKGELWIS